MMDTTWNKALEKWLKGCGAVLVALALAGMSFVVTGCRGKSAEGDRLTVRDGGREWTFVAV